MIQCNDFSLEIIHVIDATLFEMEEILPLKVKGRKTGWGWDRTPSNSRKALIPKIGFLSRQANGNECGSVCMSVTLTPV